MFRTILHLFVALVAPTALLAAQPPGDPFGAATQRVVLAAKFVPATAKPGDEVVLEVSVTPEIGWHVYGRNETTGTPTSLAVTKLAGLETVGTAEIPTGDPHDSFGMTSWWISGVGVLKQKIKVPAGAANGAKTVTARVSYMACNDEFCDPPGSGEVQATLTIEGAGTQAPAPEQDPGQEKKSGDVQVDGPGPLLDPGGELDLFDERHVYFEKARFEPNPARPGETVRIIVPVSVDEGWHVYGKADPNPMTLTPKAHAPLTVYGDNELPDGKLHQMPIPPDNFWVEGEFEIAQAFTLPNTMEAGEVEVTVELGWMACTDSKCLNAKVEAASASLTVEAGETRGAYVARETLGEGGAKGAGADGDRNEPLDEEDPFGSLWGIILAGIGAGLFALMMPCTYPMIPITISFFTKQAESRGGKVLPLALTYGIGIVLVFILIGLVAAETIVPFAQHWMTQLVIGVLFLGFGLSLLGMFTLSPPKFLMNASSKASSQGGFVGVFLMGTTLVITSFTCTAPFIGSMLAAFSTGDEIDSSRVVIGMASFGLTMALPFVILSLLPGRMQTMPRAGEWMNTLKITLGFVEIAASLKFFSGAELPHQLGVLPRELFLMLWAAIFLVTGLFLLGVVRVKDTSTEIGSGRLTGGMAVLLFSAYCTFGALGFKMDKIMTAIVPNYSAPMVESVSSLRGGKKGEPKGHEIVKDDYEAAIARAKETDKLLLVNFTGFN